MNKKQNNKRDLELLYEIGAFRHVRRMWERFLNPDFQNNVEHSFRVAWIALVLAKQEKTGDHEKILKLALLHDLPESRCGDVDYVARQYTKRNETMAVEDIFKGTSLETEAPVLFAEYKKKESIEAKIVKDADSLDVELELQEQGARGHSIHKIWQRDRKSTVYLHLNTKSAQKLWKDIYSSNPHDWHMLGRNRFNDGDWNIKKQ